MCLALFFLASMKIELYFTVINMRNQKAIDFGHIFVVITGRRKWGRLFHKLTCEWSFW